MANQQNRQDNESKPTQSNQPGESKFRSAPVSSAGSINQANQSARGGVSPTSSTRGATTSNPSGSTTGAATATARSLIDHAKETAGQAYEAVTDKAATKLDEQKSTLSEGLTTLADSVRQVSHNLGSAQTNSGLAETAAKYTDTAARRIESMAGYFDRKGVRDMARDLEGFARRNPALFLGAAFGLGLLAARFLKSTPPNFGAQSGSNEFEMGIGTDHQLSTGSKSPDLSPRTM